MPDIVNHKKPAHASKTTSVRLLITAASVAAALAGWAGLSLKFSAPQSRQTPANPVATGMLLPPLPILVPLPASMTASPASASGVRVEPAAAPAAPVVLRRVQAPPQPLAVTRSSR